jgi:hypothetical protein
MSLKTGFLFRTPFCKYNSVVMIYLSLTILFIQSTLQGLPYHANLHDILDKILGYAKCTYEIVPTESKRARGDVVVKALCRKPEGREFNSSTS